MLRYRCFVQCDTRLFMKKNLKKKQVILVKHWGIHTCPTKKKNRIPLVELEKIITDSPNTKRESLIRQEVEKRIKIRDLQGSIELAKLYTDKNFIDNTKQKLKRS